MDSYQREILDFMRSYGATHVRLEHKGGKHPKLCYDWRGKSQQPYIVAASSSDCLGATNAIADLKRRHPDGPIKLVARPRRKLTDMVPAVPFNPVPIAEMMASLAETAEAPLPEVMFNPIPLGLLAGTGDVALAGTSPVGLASAYPFDDCGHVEEPAAPPLVAASPALPAVDRAFLKRLVDEMNRVVDETDWRFAKHLKTGRWRVFTVVE